MRPGKLSLLLCVSVSVSPLGGGCTKNEYDGAPPGETVPDVDIPTQEELDQKAAEEINEANADEELEQLQQEIEEDG